MRRIALLALAAPAVVALQQAPGDVLLTNASVEEVANAAAAAGVDDVRPGKWELRIEVQSMDMGDAEVQPTVDGVVQSMEPQVTTQCVTAREARGHGAIDAFFPSSNVECRYARYALTGGNLDATMRCEIPGGSITSHMTGTLSRDRFAFDHASSAEMSTASPEIVDGKPVFPKDSTAPVQKASVRAHMSGRWIGECDSR